MVKTFVTGVYFLAPRFEWPWPIGNHGLWMDGRMDGWTDGRMDGWMDGRMDGWMD